MSREKQIPNLPRRHEVEDMEEDNEEYQLGGRPSEFVGTSCERNPLGWPCYLQQVMPEVRK